MMVDQSRRRYFEIVAVLVTGICKYFFVDVYPYKFWFILCSSIFWITYVVVSFTKDKAILRYWGFSKSGFKETFLRFLPFALLTVTAFLAYGLVTDAVIFNWHILPILLLYPIWGIIQQFLMMALISGNLRDEIKGLSVTAIVVITAIVFSIVHYPSYPLIAGTFVLALLYTPVYLKYRNVWALGLYHGWIACFFYFFVLSRDPWNELAGTM